MHAGMMIWRLFAMMDSDGDGVASLQELQAAHERIFKAMDANKDSRLKASDHSFIAEGRFRGKADMLRASAASCTLLVIRQEQRCRSISRSASSRWHSRWL